MSFAAIEDQSLANATPLSLLDAVPQKANTLHGWALVFSCAGTDAPTVDGMSFVLKIGSTVVHEFRTLNELQAYTSKAGRRSAQNEAITVTPAGIPTGLTVKLSGHIEYEPA